MASSASTAKKIVKKTSSFAQTDEELLKMPPFRRSNEERKETVGSAGNVKKVVEKKSSYAQTDEELMRMPPFRRSNEEEKAKIVKKVVKKTDNFAQTDEEPEKMDVAPNEERVKEMVSSNQNVEEEIRTVHLTAEEKMKEREKRRKENLIAMKKSVQVVDLIFRFLQNRTRILVWLYRNNKLRIEGNIIGYDQYLSMVMECAEEVYVNTGVRKQVGTILLKGDNVSLIQNVQQTIVTDRKIVDYSDCIN